MSKINPADAHSDHKAFISQLDDTIENAPMGIFKASPDGNYVYFNRALARMYGFESAEKMVCSMADVDTLICSKPEKLDHFKKILETEGELTSHESLKVPGEQRDFWVSRNISAIKDDQGNILFYQGFILDVTEQKKIEQELAQKTARLGERIKELKCINRISQAFHKGTTLEEVLKKAVAAIPPGWQYPEITAARVTHKDEVFQTRNYKDTPWRMSQVIMVNGEVSGKITVAYLIEKPEADDGPFLNEEWDLLRMIARHLSVIIERVLSEQENQHQRWRLESIIEGANPGTWEWNVVTGEAVINDTWAEIIGYKQQELKPVTSRIWKKFAHPNDLAKSNDLLKKHFAGELPGYDCDLRIRHKQGHWVWVRNRGRVVTWDEKGRAVMMFGTTTDITDRKKAREKLLQTNRQLEAETLRANEMSTRAREADQAKSQFLANMSHEIRTPMNGIIGMSELLMETKMSQEQKKYADIIRSSANSLLYLINDILDFSKIEARKLALCTDNFDLNVILGEVEDMLEYRAREQGLDFSWHIDSSVNTLLQGDPGRLRQILVNLAGNAVKFTEHGEISIRVKELSRKEKKTKLHFEVRDTGSGISLNDQKALFDPFIQAGQSARKKYQGTGLGLAISKQLAEMMNGAIGVVSEPGKGSTFWFTAEFGEHSGKSTYKPTAASKDSENEMQIFKTRHSEARVLLVEDNITNQEVTRSILHKLGFKYVDSACNGLEALECLAARKYSLVLMDCQMPEMDGFEATRAIRKGDADVLNPEVPIIAMTAYAMKTDQEKCIQAGMNYYMSKPVHPHKLARMVDMALQSIDAGEIACADSRNEVQHSVPSDPAAPVVFNESELLDRVMNDYDLMKEILGHFLEEIPDRIKHLKQSLARGDVIEAGAFAHSIKGTSANVGAHRIYTISSAISKQSAREDVADLKIMTKELVEEFECFKKHIQKYFDV